MNMDFDFALVILLAEMGVFLWLLYRQGKNRSDSWNEVEKIESKLKDFRLVIPSDVTINQLDRIVEPHLDKIRSLANGALVLGIGGTMFLFLLEAISIGGTTIWSGGESIAPALENDLWKILLGLILALSSSMVGIFSHLSITSKILSPAYERVGEKEAKLLNTPTQSPETKLSKQLEELTRAWDESDPADLFELIPKFLQGQTAVMQSMQEGFQKHQTTALEVMESQKEFTEKNVVTLTTLCDNVEKLSASAKEIGESHTKLRDEVSNSLEQLLQEQKSLKRELESLPQNIRDSIVGIDELFGKQAKTHVHELRHALEEKISELMEKLGEYQRKQSLKLFEENREVFTFFENLRSEIQNNIVHPLREVATQLKETTATIPEIEQDLQKSAQAFSGIPEKLEEAGKEINEVVRSTASEALTPVSDKMNQYIETVEETHQSLEKIIQNLVSLIRNTIRSIEGKK